ncbi:MAG: glycosyltransferase family 4 protein [Firmicutes bacterium]|nr:glycosyltransferase family 4 protein [Bacillota bacterium]
MKILYLTNSIPKPSNVMKGIFNFRRIKELKNLNMDVKVVSINNILRRNLSIQVGKNYNFKDLNYDFNIEINVFNNLKLPGIESLTNIYKRLAKYIKTNRIDIVHAHFVGMGYIAYKLKKYYGIPYVVTAHGSDIHTNPFKSKKNRKKALLALNNANEVIFVSEFLKRKAMDFGYNNNNFNIIPNGIEKSFLDVESKPKHKRRLIGFVGNLKRIKRADVLPDIFYEVLKKINNVEFVIVGEGPLKSNINNKLEDLNIKNKVMLTGKIHPNEVKKYMKEMDIMILPSKKEGWGCVVLEAHATGTLVLGSNNGGIPEAVGNMEWIIEDDKDLINKFSSKIIYYLEKGYNSKELKQRARNYTWDKIIQKEIKVYKNILEQI